MHPDTISRTPVRLQGNLFFLSAGQCIHSNSKKSCVFMYRLFKACLATLGYSDKRGKITKEKPDKMIVNQAKVSKLFAWE
jgi:hypothetical protein